MSDTIVDMAKVTQMLDAGWEITLFKNGMKSYTAKGFHPNGRVRDALAEQFDREAHWDDNERLLTDDFTPEQALTRLAYKVHGEII